MTLKDTTVLVLGLGASGLAMAQWCAREGAIVRVADSREQPPQTEALAASLPQAELHLGFDAGLLDGVARVLKSPGLSPLDPALQPVLARAAADGVPVQGELDLFAQALATLKAERGYAPQVIAITGTNGKTTTTMMCTHLVARSGASVAVAGNVGPTMLATLAAALATGEALPEVWVLELSSFQLDGVQGFAPTAAVALNLSQDHLDWHGSMAAYAAAKARVYGPPDQPGTLAVVNRDDAQIEAMLAVPAGAPAASSASKAARSPRGPTPAIRPVIRFGLEAPEQPGDYGVVVENGMAWMVRALEAEPGLKRRRGDPAAVAAEDLHLQRLMPADALRLRGRHNVGNALAALALATAIGRPLAPMLHGLRDYRGEPHRMELIASLDGVEIYDDSKGTNVGATVAALDGLGAERGEARLWVILGGDGKGQDFTPLARPLARWARGVALIGRDAALIGAVAQAARADLPITTHATLDDAVLSCLAQARSGDALLLSPACASFDMFRGYAHRAEVFADAVRAFAAERGVAA